MMYCLIVWGGVFFVILGLLGLWNSWSGRKFFFEKREKASPFECGFDPKDSARCPFSIRFFMLLLLFLIFDVELALLLQLPYVVGVFFFESRWFYVGFFWILILGVLEEWRRGFLSWVKA